MSASAAINIVLGVLLVGLVIYRQLVTRPVRSNPRLPIILGVIGLIELVQFLGDHHATGKIALGLGGSLVLAGIFGAARAITTKVWVDSSGVALQKGNWLTAVLWVGAIAVHLAYDELIYKNGSLGGASILLYLAVTFGIQRVIMANRAQRLSTGAQPVHETQVPH